MLCCVDEKIQQFVYKKSSKIINLVGEEFSFETGNSLLCAAIIALLGWLCVSKIESCITN